MPADTTQPAGAPSFPVPAWTPMRQTAGYAYDDDNLCDYAARWAVYASAPLMAERDAAREELAELRAEMGKRNKSPSDRLHNLCAALEEDANESPFSREAWDQLAAEAAALRRELEELRKAGAPMANTMFNLTQRDSMPAHERESFKRMQVAWDAALRAIPPDARELLTPERVDEIWQECSDPDRADMSIQQFAEAIQRAAREGREPLTDDAILTEWVSSDLQPQILSACDVFGEGVRFAERMHGIGPAGTSTDGETQPTDPSADPYGY